MTAHIQVSAFGHRDAIGRTTIAQHTHQRHTIGGAWQFAAQSRSRAAEQPDHREMPPVAARVASAASLGLSRHGRLSRNETTKHGTLMRKNDWMPASGFDLRALPLTRAVMYPRYMSGAQGSNLQTSDLPQVMVLPDHPFV